MPVRVVRHAAVRSRLEELSLKTISEDGGFEIKNLMRGNDKLPAPKVRASPTAGASNNAITSKPTLGGCTRGPTTRCVRPAGSGSARSAAIALTRGDRTESKVPASEPAPAMVLTAPAKTPAATIDALNKAYRGARPLLEARWSELPTNEQRAAIGLALTSALVTALLFVVGKWAIGLYLGRAAISSTYGAAGSVIVLLLWVYYASFIVLLGAEFTRAYSLRIKKHAVPPEKGAKTAPAGADVPT